MPEEIQNFLFAPFEAGLRAGPGVAGDWKTGAAEK